MKEGKNSRAVSILIKSLEPLTTNFVLPNEFGLYNALESKLEKVENYSIIVVQTTIIKQMTFETHFTIIFQKLCRLIFALLYFRVLIVL